MSSVSGIDALSARLDTYLTPDQITDIRRAYFYSAHDGQFRRNGDPYITHPLAVADILATCTWTIKA
jgi:guanosine-3',5'-bis(diphosphate) 3'-pyrophosphohydrolase